MRRGVRAVFTYSGEPIPPLIIRGKPGDLWPADGPLRLSVEVAAGNPSAALALKGGSLVAATAELVVGGVPSGTAVDISTGELALGSGTHTFDLRVEILPHAEAFVEQPIAFAVWASEPGGHG
jgi:hypothetical protein